MTPSKIRRVRDRHVWFALWTCTHELYDSESLSWLTRGTEKIFVVVYVRRTKQHFTSFAGIVLVVWKVSRPT